MQALYMYDCYLKEFEAAVISVNNKYIVLDNTAFYPNSGGQPHDTGTITRVSDNEEFGVVFVAKVDNSISHEVDREGLKTGDKVTGKIDWDRRYLFMRYHTACHVLSGIINQETGAEITGNQIGADKTRIDFDVESFNKDMIKDYENKANKIISEARNVYLKTMSRDEALKIPSLFKLAKGFPETIEVLRIVEIENFDQQACGGTHIKNTKEIGTIEIIKTENKGKSNRRLYFVIK